MAQSSPGFTLIVKSRKIGPDSFGDSSIFSVSNIFSLFDFSRFAGSFQNTLTSVSQISPSSKEIPASSYSILLLARLLTSARHKKFSTRLTQTAACAY